MWTDLVKVLEVELHKPAHAMVIPEKNRIALDKGHTKETAVIE